MNKGFVTCADVVPRATAAAALLALVALPAAWSRPRSVEVGPTGLWLDRPGSVVVVLITAVAAVVTSYARRSLRGEPYRDRFFALAGLVTIASVVLATAATITLLTAAWLVVSAGVAGLIGLTGTPEARAAARRTRRTFAIGDVALVAATTLVLWTWGDVSLRGPVDAVGAGPIALVGLLVVVAAATRSALVPASSWLVGTVWAPTPVSALLHAGVVNAGGVLLVRLWGLVGITATITHLLLLLGTATLAVGTLQARARSDVKGALAASTVAQMGFMTLTIATGAHAAAWLHLVAHGLFKASLFLGSGSAIRTSVRARQHPRRPDAPSSWWRAAGVAVPASAVAGAVVLESSGGLGAGDVVLGAALVAAASAGAGAALHRAGSVPARIVAIGGAALLASTYLVLAHEVDDALVRDLPDPGNVPGIGWLLGVGAVVAAVTVVIRRSVRGAGSNRDALYGALVVPRMVEGPELALVAGPTSGPFLEPATTHRDGHTATSAEPAESAVHLSAPDPVGAQP